MEKEAKKKKKEEEEERKKEKKKECKMGEMKSYFYADAKVSVFIEILNGMM